MWDNSGKLFANYIKADFSAVKPKLLFMWKNQLIL